MSRKRLIVTGALVALTLVIVGGLFAARSLPAYANIASGYTAQQTCACLYVANRELESCLADFPADAISHITIETDEDRVRTSALAGMFKAEAVYEDGFGCSIVN